MFGPPCHQCGSEFNWLLGKDGEQCKCGWPNKKIAMGPIARSPNEPDVENKTDWLVWCMGYFKTTDIEWCIQRWIVTATLKQLPADIKPQASE